MHLIKNYKNIVITSAYLQEMLGKELQVISYLNKPISFDQFLKAVETFIDMNDI